MLRYFELVPLFTLALACLALSAGAWPTNYLSGKLGASVSTGAALQKGSDPNAILGDGVVSKGAFFFAEVDQPQVFTVDLGEVREFDRVNFGSIGYQEPRNAKQLVISASSDSADGPYTEALRLEKVGNFQILRLPLIKARWVKFDLGAGNEGAQVHSVKIYKAHTVPSLPEVMQMLAQRIQPGLPGLEEYDKAVQQQDWQAAASHLRAYYAKAQKPADPPNPKADLSAPLEYVKGPRGETVPIDWSYQETRDWYEYQKFLNRGRMLAYPLSAYYDTADPVWRDRFRAVFYDWITANPCPPETIYADLPTWRTLDSAMRLGWLQEGFPKITAATGLDDEIWANYLFSLWQHANYLSHDKISGGNWLSTITFRVMELALILPEFKDQRSWLVFGKDGFEKNVLRDVHPDGKEKEDAPGYVCMAYTGMLRTLKALDKASVPVDPEVLRRMDRVQDFIGAITQPHGIMPAIGDCRGTHPYVLPESWAYFKRNDIQYILTRGKEGEKPKQASQVFPDGAWAVMRSPYEAEGEAYEDARQLIFKASHASHGHRDYLSFTLYSYGRPLLIDPGIKSYEREDGARYIQTAYHNTICINGENQPAVWGSIDRWASNGGMDYLLSTYKGYEGKTHSRAIFFVKPDYWLVLDRVDGQGDARSDQNWHFNEDAGLKEEPHSKSVRTNYKKDGNLLMLPVSTENLISESKDFFIAKGGGAVASGEGEVASKGWRYTKTGALPHTMDLVMFPYKGSKVPNVQASYLGEGSTDSAVIEVKHGDNTDLIFISRTGMAEFSHSDFTFKGEAGVLRLRDSKPISLYGSRLQQVSYRGKVLFERDAPKELVFERF